MLNYFKFASYQIIGFSLSIPKLIKFKKSADKFTLDEKFTFLKKQARESLSFINIDLTILGKSNIPNEPVLYVVNHASMLDSFILLSSVDRPIGCLIADEPIWKNLPVVKDWASLIKCVYINRSNNREGIKSIIDASNNIISGHSMAVFPEGDLTWVKDPQALVSDFRSGALKIAYKAKCPIVPLVIKNSKYLYDGYQPIGKITPYPVEVEFLDPIYDHIHNPRLKSTQLAETIKNNMIDKIKEFKNK